MAIIPAAHLLTEFVDRIREVGEFSSLLQQRDGAIVCIWGPGGIGKSVLVTRLMQECESRGIRWVISEWRDSSRYSYLDLMRRIRDRTQPDLFNSFNDRVNFYTAPQYRLQIEMQGSPIEHVQVSTGSIDGGTADVQVGHRVEIRDLMLNVLRPDQAASDETVSIELTNVFFECLRGYTGSRRVVLLFDALEKADLRTRDWIVGELLCRVRDGDLPNTVVLLSGREALPLDPSFFAVQRVFSLVGLSQDHVFEYLNRKGLPNGGLLAAFLAQQYQGNPLQIASAVNGFLLSQSRGAANA
jgi:hypothetical protein